jgi:hypothetical protein
MSSIHDKDTGYILFPFLENEKSSRILPISACKLKPSFESEQDICHIGLSIVQAFMASKVALTPATSTWLLSSCSLPKDIV